MTAQVQTVRELLDVLRIVDPDLPVVLRADIYTDGATLDTAIGRLRSIQVTGTVVRLST